MPLRKPHRTRVSNHFTINPAGPVATWPVKQRLRGRIRPAQGAGAAHAVTPGPGSSPAHVALAPQIQLRLQPGPTPPELEGHADPRKVQGRGLLLLLLPPLVQAGLAMALVLVVG